LASLLAQNQSGSRLILTKILKRAKELTQKGSILPCSDNLQFFMQHKIEKNDFNPKTLHIFAQLDDIDVFAAIKDWQNNPDFILSSLSKMIINRDLLKIKLNTEKIFKQEKESLISKFAEQHKISEKDTKYFIFSGKIVNQAYSKEAEPIRILMKNKTIEDVVHASDQLNLKSISKAVTKYYLCFPKELIQ
jgi:uncharacterized protein